MGNSAVGWSALTNTIGSSNTSLGYQAGMTVGNGSNNTLIGSNADVTLGTLNYATAIGSGAVVSVSNAIVLGRNPIGSDPATDYVGIGTSQPNAALHVNGGHVNRIEFTTVSVTLTPDNYIMVVVANGQTITLPSGGSLVNGHTFIVKNDVGITSTINVQGGGNHIRDTVSAVASISAADGASYTFVYAAGGGDYYVVGH